MKQATEEHFVVRLIRCDRGLEDIDHLWVELLGANPDPGSAAGRGGDDHPVRADRILSRQASALSTLATEVMQHAEREPLIVALDDVHAASPIMVELADRLIQRMRQQPFLPFILAVAARPTPGGTGIAKVLADLRSFEGCIGLDVGPLSSAEESELIRQQTLSATPTFIGMVRAASGGNPLRSKAAVGMLRQSGVVSSIDADHDVSTLRVEMASMADDPVTEWLKTFPSMTTAVLRAAAVVGGTCTIEDLEQVSPDLDSHDGGVDRALGATVDLGILASDGHRYWFVHQLYQDAVHSMTPHTLQREINGRRAAALLANAPEDGPVWLSIGRHLVRADDDLEAIGVDAMAFVRAGRAALGLGEWFESAQLFRRALSAGGPRALRPSDRATALYLCGVAHYFDHDRTGAVGALSDAASLADHLGDEDLQANALTIRLRTINNMDVNAYRQPTDLAETMAFVEASDRADLRALLLQACAETYITAGQLDRGRELADAALGLAGRGTDETTQAVCAYAVGYADLTASRVRSSLPSLLDAARLAHRGGDWYVESALESRLAFAHLGVGDLHRAQVAAERALESAVAHSEHSAQALSGAVLSTVSLLSGDIRLARSHLHEARLATDRASYRGADLFLGPVEVFAALYEREHEEARAAVGRWPSLPGILRRELLALISAHELEGPAADAPPPLPRWRENQISVAALTLDLQAALLTGDSQRLEQLDHLVEPLRRGEVTHPPMAPFALDRLLGELDLALGRTADAVQALGRTAERLRATGANAELALTSFAQARAAAQLDEPPDNARRLAARAAELTGRAGMSWSHDAARAFAGSGAEERPLVEARGGDWTIILVTDIVGSTRISTDFGDVTYHDIVMAHHEIVRDACRRFGGHETADSGDGLCFWFDATDEAIRAALEIQRAVAVHRADGPRLAVKVSLAGGEPLFRHDRPYGLVLNRAFRIVDEARDGQVLLDEPVANSLAPDLIASQLAPRDLKGIGPHTISILDADAAKNQRSSAASFAVGSNP